MGASGGPIVYDGVSAKAQLKSDSYVAVRDGINGPVTVPAGVYFVHPDYEIL